MERDVEITDEGWGEGVITFERVDNGLGTL
jgi:hypothetical protein